MFLDKNIKNIFGLEEGETGEGKNVNQKTLVRFTSAPLPPQKRGTFPL